MEIKIKKRLTLANRPRHQKIVQIFKHEYIDQIPCQQHITIPGIINWEGERLRTTWDRTVEKERIEEKQESDYYF